MSKVTDSIYKRNRKPCTRSRIASHDFIACSVQRTVSFSKIELVTSDIIATKLPPAAKTDGREQTRIMLILEEYEHHYVLICDACSESHPLILGPLQFSDLESIMQYSLAVLTWQHSHAKRDLTYSTFVAKS